MISLTSAKVMFCTEIKDAGVQSVVVDSMPEIGSFVEGEIERSKLVKRISLLRITSETVSSIDQVPFSSLRHCSFCLSEPVQKLILLRMGGMILIC